MAAGPRPNAGASGKKLVSAGTDIYLKLQETAYRELSENVDTTLPDPTELPYDAEEWDLYYQVWSLWTATGERFLLSDLTKELQNGYGRMWNGVLDIKSFYGKLKEEMRQKNGRGNGIT